MSHKKFGIIHLGYPILIGNSKEPCLYPILLCLPQKVRASNDAVDKHDIFLLFSECRMSFDANKSFFDILTATVKE